MEKIRISPCTLGRSRFRQAKGTLSVHHKLVLSTEKAYNNPKTKSDTQKPANKGEGRI